MQETRLDTARIRAARGVIDPVFLDTPLYRCEALEPGLGCKVSIKLETANPVRSFKARGTEVVASLLAGYGSRAVVCASAGNLGQALAWSGRGRGLEVTVVASRFAPAAKLDRIRALEARLELVDGDFEAARERAADLARDDGIRLVEDSADIETCEGAATIGLELTGTVPAFKARQQGTLQLGQPFDDPVPLAGIPFVRSAVLLRPDQSVMARIECVAAEAGGDRFWAGAGP